MCLWSNDRIHYPLLWPNYFFNFKFIWSVSTGVPSNTITTLFNFQCCHNMYLNFFTINEVGKICGTDFYYIILDIRKIVFAIILYIDKYLAGFQRCWHLYSNCNYYYHYNTLCTCGIRTRFIFYLLWVSYLCRVQIDLKCFKWWSIWYNNYCFNVVTICTESSLQYTKLESYWPDLYYIKLDQILL